VEKKAAERIRAFLHGLEEFGPQHTSTAHQHQPQRSRCSLAPLVSKSQPKAAKIYSTDLLIMRLRTLKCSTVSHRLACSPLSTERPGVPLRTSRTPPR
jgi:hypothetical protein